MNFRIPIEYFQIEIIFVHFFKMLPCTIHDIVL